MSGKSKPRPPGWGFESVVHVVGGCDDMPAAYMLSDVVVSASTDPEAFGRVVAEGQAMGRPVVAPAHGAAPEIVIPGATGWLFEPGNAEDLARNLETALALGQRRTRRAGPGRDRQRAPPLLEGPHDRETLDLYREVLAETAAESGIRSRREPVTGAAGPGHPAWRAGRLVMSFGPFQAIRQAHADARITLLTTPPFAELCERSGWFDAVWTDDGRAFPARRWLRCARAEGRRLRHGLRPADVRPVVALFSPDAPEPAALVGHRPRLRLHPHANPSRNEMHTLDRQADQLAFAGIDAGSPPDLGWMTGDIGRFGLPARFALLVPGATTHRAGEALGAGTLYGALARIWRPGVTPVLIGTAAERDACRTIRDACPAADRPGPARPNCPTWPRCPRGGGAVGNDTGPVHIAALSGCPTLMLLSDATHPSIAEPRWDHVGRSEEAGSGRPRRGRGCGGIETAINSRVRAPARILPTTA